jgi:hypothetical protein
MSIRSRRGGSGVEWCGDACVARRGEALPFSLNLCQ